MGYTKIDLNVGFNLLGQQFVKVGNDAAFDLQEIITSVNMAGFDTESVTPQTTIQIWTPSGYVSYDWFSPENLITWDGYGYENLSEKWVWLDDDFGDFVAAQNVTVPASEGFWINTTAQSSMYFVGQVYTPTEETVPIATGFNLVSNPFPVKWNIQDFTSTDMAGFDTESVTPQTTIIIWTPSGYVSYDYFSPENLIEWDGYGYDDLAGKWVWLDDDFGDFVAAENVEIPVGEGFWINTVKSTSMKFTR